MLILSALHHHHPHHHYHFQAADDAAAVDWYDVSKLLSGDVELAFDHATLVRDLMAFLLLDINPKQ